MLIVNLQRVRTILLIRENKPNVEPKSEVVSRLMNKQLTLFLKDIIEITVRQD